MKAVDLWWILILCLPASAGAHVSVSADTAIFIDAREPKALQKAAVDLAADFERVFGRVTTVSHDPPNAGASVIRIVLDESLPAGVERPTGWERLHIQVVDHAVVLTGSDVRGAIYAIYQFSQQFLGVDPLYWWTDHPPQRRAAVAIPTNFSLTDGPEFHYRGWFINDEDLLTGWTPGKVDGTGIALRTWDHIFEALLRLKGDLVIPGTFIFPDEPQIRAAAERGLIIGQHHVTTLGLNTYRWPKDRPMSLTTHPKLMESAWTRAVSEYPGNAEILWSVGFRGNNDHPFWEDDPNAPTSSEGRAGLIRAAIDRQISIVRRQYPEAEFFLNAWAETSTFIHEGVLRVPDGVTLIWPDNGHGILQDRNMLAAGQGEYYHSAMFDGLSNHYSEKVPLERIQRELGRAAAAGANRLLLVNTANLRPVVMTVRAELELGWKSGDWRDPESEASRDYLLRWCQEEFGERAARRVAEYYRAYFEAPARYVSAEDAAAGDNYYLTGARFLLLAALEGQPDFPSWKWLLQRDVPNVEALANALLEPSAAADPRWQRAARLAEQAEPLVRKGRRDFYHASVRTQVALHRHLNRMLLNLARMTLAATPAEKLRQLSAAIEDGERAAAALHAAEYGKWRGFYTAGDWLLDTPGCLALAKAYRERLQGHSIAAEAYASQDWQPRFVAAYSKITAYEGSRTAEFGPQETQP